MTAKNTDARHFERSKSLARKTMYCLQAESLLIVALLLNTTQEWKVGSPTICTKQRLRVHELHNDSLNVGR